MGFATLVTVKRGIAQTTRYIPRVFGGTIIQSGLTQTIGQNIPVRLDNISPVVAAQIGGASPYNTYELESMVGVPDIRQGDQLMDQNNIDPKTGNNVLYRVMGNPETWDGSYLSTLVEKLVGKVPA
jgi:hypothetical protein